ncbi:MAG TPA: hypothetical protein ENK24_06660 [Anaerolineae bacterium]|nr:hypothetical protein [Anaerolineae bacterium]
MTTAQMKLNILQEVVGEDEAFNRILDKLLDVTLFRYRARLNKLNTDLKKFELQYEMDSPTFYQKFEQGELGDDMDFFEWAGLFELQQDLVEKLKYQEAIKWTAPQII